MGTDQQPQPEGTTLLAGYVNDVAQGNGTLHDLYKVEPGALVYVADPAGAVTRWRVVGLDVVVKAAPGSWRGETRASKYGFPLFIVLAIVAGALMWVAISQRTPPSDAAAQPYPASATPTPSAAPITTRTPTATATSSAPPSTAPVRLAVFGGEATNGSSPDFVGKKLGDSSWVNYVAGPGVNVVAGWADPGASSQRIAAAARPVSADVLVIDIGVEDQINKTPFSETTTNIGKIVTTVNAPKVRLLGAPPFASAPNAAGTLNTQLRQLANDRGWTFLDAAVGVRDGTEYKNGTSG